MHIYKSGSAFCWIDIGLPEQAMGWWYSLGLGSAVYVEAILNFHAMKARSTHAGLPVHSITQGTLDIHEPIIAQLQTVPNTEVTIALSLYM